MDWKKFASHWGVATLVGFYTTLVAQCLWNWFAVPLFNAPQAGYWEIYGLTMLIGIFFARNDFKHDHFWSVAFITLDACVRPEQRDDLNQEIKDENEHVWFKVGQEIFGQVITNSITLAMGWAIHAFLV